MTALLPARAASGSDMLGAWRVNSVNCVDALAFMEGLPSQSVHAIISDFPYGTTACSWDEIIPFEPMWAGIKRILKPRGVVVTTASQPFTTKLINSNFDWFKYGWIWVKSQPGDPTNAKNRPMKAHEEILVFSSGTTANGSDNKMPYYPQHLTKSNRKRTSGDNNPGKFGGSFKPFRPSHHAYIQEFTDYPTSVLIFENETGFHPTQKPVALYEYLIRTYTQPGELVLDFCCGSGTTGVACVKTGRNYILCDTAREYVDISLNRIHAGFVTLDVAEGIQQPSLFAGLAG